MKPEPREKKKKKSAHNDQQNMLLPCERSQKGGDTEPQLLRYHHLAWEASTQPPPGCSRTAAQPRALPAQAPEHPTEQPCSPDPATLSSHSPNLPQAALLRKGLLGNQSPAASPQPQTQ